MIDATRLARAYHETTGERLERWDAEHPQTRAVRDEPFRAKPFDELPESSRQNLIEQAEAAAARYGELEAEEVR